VLRKEFEKMYKSAENAYAALDFTGIGYITEEAFLNSIVVKDRTSFTTAEIREYFNENNLFNAESKGINFDNFKKNFFPHLYLVQDDKDDLDDIAANNIR